MELQEKYQIPKVPYLQSKTHRLYKLHEFDEEQQKLIRREFVKERSQIHEVIGNSMRNLRHSSEVIAFDCNEQLEEMKKYFMYEFDFDSVETSSGSDICSRTLRLREIYLRLTVRMTGYPRGILQATVSGFFHDYSITYCGNPYDLIYQMSDNLKKLHRLHQAKELGIV